MRTSWCIHDCIELEKRGIPTVAVRTDEFFALAKTEAMGWDMPGLPLVVVPHPLAKRSPDECGQFAAGVLGEIADALTANAQTVETKYRAKTLEAGGRRRYRSLFESEFNAPDAPLRIEGPDATDKAKNCFQAASQPLRHRRLDLLLLARDLQVQPGESSISQGCGDDLRGLLA